MLANSLSTAPSLTTGLVAAEIWRIAFYLGTNLAPILSDARLWAEALGVLAGVLLCLTYSIKRGAHVAVAQMGRSLRVDLLIAAAIGIWANTLASPWLANAHKLLKNDDPLWGAAVLSLLCAMLLSPLIQQYGARSKRTIPQLYFMADEEIGDEKEDFLESEMQAKSFAETVLVSFAQNGLVFGGRWTLGNR